jgi:hypothetical protein
MKKCIFLLIFVFVAQFLFAEISVTNKQIAKKVENREPIEPGTKFSKNIGKLYCFTEVKTDKYPTSIVHLWLYNNNIMAEIPLSVNSNRWRTFSSKKILPTQTGKWKVEIYTNDDKLIDSIEFEIVDE